MVDLDTDSTRRPDDQNTVSGPPSRCRLRDGRERRFAQRRLPRSGKWLARALIVVLCSLHGLAIWWGLGGRAGLTNGWPLWRDDHPLYYHTALVTRSFLKIFVDDRRLRPQLHGGLCQERRFPVVVDTTRTGGRGIRRQPPRVRLQDLCADLGGGGSLADRPGVRPVASSRGGSGDRRLARSALHLDRLPDQLRDLGMLPYFLAIPVGLAATGAFARFLVKRRNVQLARRNGPDEPGVSLFTSPRPWSIVPAAALAYVAASFAESAVLPAPIARSTAPGGHSDSPVLGASSSADSMVSPGGLDDSGHRAGGQRVLVAAGDLAGLDEGRERLRVHPSRGGGRRLVADRRIPESPVQSILLAAGLPGLFLIWRREPSAGLGLLRILRCRAVLGIPGRSVRGRSISCSPGGTPTLATRRWRLPAGRARRAVAASSGRFAGVDHLDRWVMAGLPCSVFACWAIRSIVGSTRPESSSVCGASCLVRCVGSSRSCRAARRRACSGSSTVSSATSSPASDCCMKRGVKAFPAFADPFQGGRFSGLLPERTGVEVIGGPYLHASLKTNFTQFGEGKLFGRADWDRAYFVRYAKLYRPSAILCWSPHARRFCQENPDLVKVLEDDGTVLIGRVVGFEGDFIEGGGRVEAAPGRIRVTTCPPALTDRCCCGITPCRI